MNEQIQQIAERLAGLRDALEITPEEMAKVCNLTTEQYLLLESGTVDISVSVLHQISQAYGVQDHMNIGKSSFHFRFKIRYLSFRSLQTGFYGICLL